MAVRKEELPQAVLHTDQKNILIIDDSPTDREYYERCLEDLGFNVVAASGGDEGQRKIERQPFDCILLDYFLPRENGIDVLNAIRLDPDRAGPPVILITGAGNEDVAVSAWKSGAADYLAKDKITPESLKRAVTNAVEKHDLRRALAEHAAELEAANRALRKRNEEVSRFYMNVSHELNTPLAAAQEFVSLVRDKVAGPLTDEQAEYLDDALDSHRLLAQHIDDLIETTRLNNGKMKVNPVPVDFHALVRRVLAANAQLSRDKSVAIETDIPDEMPRVLADRNRIFQVLCNLVRNAVKHSHTRLPIVVRAELLAHSVNIVVEDSGCGIDPLHQTGIFDRLFQVPKPGESDEGLGLGLSIAQEIVKLHGSEIHVASEPGKGSAFSFELALNTP